VPKIRTLRSALVKKLPGRTRVVCQSTSMKLVRASIKKARTTGYHVRPSDHRTITNKQGRRLLATNRKLRKLCKFKEIQPAVTASRNNDRVVIMPGVYTEPTSRAQPTHDTRCDNLRTNGDRPGDEGSALSYAYQASCPNDQNLVALIGREVGSEGDPMPPRQDRFGIPNLGACIRCNVQVEGSGVSADDVVIEAGDASKGNGGPSGAGHAKDVAIRADRADGFVLRNITTRHAGEHGIYVIETDGYVLDRFKAYYDLLYGTLTFASDHGRQQNCEATGHGDSGVYPGGAPDTGAQRPAGTSFRYNQLVRLCDLHHNMSGFSGTSGNAVHVKNNRVYDNALGLTTDTVTAAGHPGYPGDSAMFERNEIFSNNFNVYDEKSDVRPSFPFPVGTGMWIAGGNRHRVRENYFYDNWRRGAMVFSVPDSLVCGPAAGGNEQAGCSAGQLSTSHYNHLYDNHIGVRPDGTPDPNGTDWWWDSFVGSRGNCWWRNTGPKPATSSPANLPNCSEGKDPATSVGTGAPDNEAELVSCVAAFETRNYDPNGPCPWVKAPTEPGQPSTSKTFQPVFPPLAARSAAPPTRGPVPREPLGQISCRDWNRTSDADRPALADRLRGFAGGVVNTGQRDVGTGATLTYDQVEGLYSGWCSRAYAQDFLLYKLYTAAAALKPQD
jgi:hypothetical protein